MTTPHALYRFYDLEDRLLYVGITLDLGARWKYHSKNKTWWTDVVRCTVEHFLTREAVLIAEKAAIIAEKPRWNIVHNGKVRGAKVAARGFDPMARQPAGIRPWRYESAARDHTRVHPLWLYWEMNGDPITDDYFVDEMSADELWREWRRDMEPEPATEALFGPGARRIWWFVEGDGVESAPFQDWRGVPFENWNFLTHFTWPVDPETDERMSWASLPVADKLWRPGHADKGGFIQEVTGWKPSPLQPFVNLKTLEQMSGLTAAYDA